VHFARSLEAQLVDDNRSRENTKAASAVAERLAE